RVAEGAVGIARHAGEFARVERARDVGRQDLANRLGIGPPGQGGDPVRRKKGPGFRHIEPAVTGQTGKRHIDEAERGCLASGRNVPHGSDPSGRADQRPIRMMEVDTGEIGLWLGPAKTAQKCPSEAGFSFRRARAKATKTAINTAARLNQVSAYCRWLFGRLTVSLPGCGRPPGGTGASCST